MESKAYTVKKQCYFWFDGEKGFVVYQLAKPNDSQGGLYLIRIDDKDQIFSFSTLKSVEEISDNEVITKVRFPDRDGFVSNKTSKWRFNQIISMFKEGFDEK